MSDAYRSEAQRLEQAFADAYAAYRKHLETTSYPASEEDWAEHDRYQEAVSAASTAWGDFCINNRHLR
ncbi:hypothetical protein [Pseudomonas sp. DC3000-4b1]|uniref:hypothetical protein n=1 Tax=unclassified Pseudomonas TaxID=196821 RepID=UPI003CF66632